MKNFRVELTPEQVEPAEAHAVALGYEMFCRAIDPDCLYAYPDGDYALHFNRGGNQVKYPSLTFDEFMQLTKEDVL